MNRNRTLVRKQIYFIDEVRPVPTLSFEKLIFAQLMEHLPEKTLARCVARYRGNHKIQSFTCQDQFLCMAFAQLTFRESLRDIEACLRSQTEKLDHMGIRAQV